MVALSIVFIILLFLTVDMVVQRRQLRAAQQESRGSGYSLAPPRGALAQTFASVPDGVALSPLHSWARCEPADQWCVGGVPLLYALLGTPDLVELAPPGTWICRGEPVATLQRGQRRLNIPSPLSGVVSASNLDVAEVPHRLQEDPYGTGWLCRLESRSPKDTGSGLLTGAEAREFIANEIQRVRDTLTRFAEHPAVGPAMADGGLPSPQMISELDTETWQRVIDELLNRGRKGAS